jgi:hypothetical protein
MAADDMAADDTFKIENWLQFRQLLTSLHGIFLLNVKQQQLLLCYEAHSHSFKVSITTAVRARFDNVSRTIRAFDKTMNVLIFWPC